MARLLSEGRHFTRMVDDILSSAIMLLDLLNSLFTIHLQKAAEYMRSVCIGLSLWLIGTVRAEAETVINPQTRQNKLFQDYWRACFEINFSDRQEGLTVSSIICDR